MKDSRQEINPGSIVLYESEDGRLKFGSRKPSLLNYFKHQNNS